MGGVPAETFTSPEGLRPIQDFDAGLDEVERRTKNGEPEYGNYISHWYDDYDIALKNGQNWADPQWDASAWKPVQIPGTFQELGISDIPSLTWFRKEIYSSLTRCRRVRRACIWDGWRRWTPPSSTDVKSAQARGWRILASTAFPTES